MTDHMSLLMKTVHQRNEELAREHPSETVILACDVAIRKLQDAGHCKTFAMMSDLDTLGDDKRESDARGMIGDWRKSREGKE